MATVKKVQESIEWAFQNDNRGLHRFLNQVFGANMDETTMKQSHEMLLRFIAQIPYCLNVLIRAAKGTQHEAFAKLVQKRCLDFYVQDEEPLPDNYFKHYGVGMLLDDAYFVARTMERLSNEIILSQSFKKNFFAPNGFLKLVLGDKIVAHLNKDIDKMLKDAQEKTTRPSSPSGVKKLKAKLVGTWVTEHLDSITPEHYMVVINYRRSFKANGQFTTWVQLKNYDNATEPDILQYGRWEIKNDKLLLHHQYKKRTETYPFSFSTFSHKEDYNSLLLKKPVVSKKSVKYNPHTIGYWKRI